MNLNEVGCVDVDWIHTADDGYSFGSCEHGSGYSLCIKRREFLY
jgi:hypothetical protein